MKELTCELCTGMKICISIEFWTHLLHGQQSRPASQEAITKYEATAKLWPAGKR